MKMEKQRLDSLTEYAAELAARLIEKREKEGKVPYVAFLDEMLVVVVDDLKEVMRQYVRDKVFTCHPDVNGRIMFEFTPSK